MLHNFNTDGFDSLHPHYAGGRPPKFSPINATQIKKIALGRPADHGLPFSTWSLSKLADYLVAKGVVEDISHEGLRMLLARARRLLSRPSRPGRPATDPDYEAKKNRVLELYDIADGKAEPGAGDPDVVICMDEFGPLNLAAPPRAPVGPGRHGHRGPGRPAPAPAAGHLQTPARGEAPAAPATTCPPTGSTGTSRSTSAGPTVPGLHAHYLRVACTPWPSASPSSWTTTAPHLSTRIDTRVGDWAAANNVELAYVPFYGSWLNRIEPQFTATALLRPATAPTTPATRRQASMIRRYIIWRNRHTTDPKAAQGHPPAPSLIKRAKVA